jgi:hypothetical protein
MNFVSLILEDGQLSRSELELLFSISSVASPSPNLVVSIDTDHKVHVTDNYFFNRLDFESKIDSAELLALSDILALTEHTIRINSNRSELVLPLYLLLNLFLNALLFFRLFVIVLLILFYRLISCNSFFAEKS